MFGIPRRIYPDIWGAGWYATNLEIASGTLSLKAEFIGHTGEIRGLKAHGNTVVSGSYDTQVRVWNSLTGECLKTLRGHRGRVHSVEYDGVRIATSSEDRDIRVWDPSTGYVAYPYLRC